MTERIKIEIDDRELDVALAKLDTLILKSRTALGTAKVAEGAKTTAFYFKDFWILADKVEEVEATGLLDQLPTINREMRLILGQVPGLREAMAIWFRIRRLARGVDVGDTTLLLTIIATAILLIRAVIERQQMMERNQQRYDTFIRRSRDLTVEEYKKLTGTRQSFWRSRPG